MIEAATNARTRDAFRAAHEERARVVRQGLRAIFGTRHRK